MTRRRNLLAIGAALALGAGVVTTQALAAPAGARLHAATKTVKAVETSTYAWAPTKATIKVGDKVTWKNATDAPHTVTSTTSSWKFDKQLPSGSKTVSVTF